MRFIIHFEYDYQENDKLIIEKSTLREIQEEAKREVEKRKPDNYWSERLN